MERIEPRYREKEQVPSPIWTKKKKTNFKAENKSLLCKDEDMQDEDMLTYKHVQLKKKEKGLTWMLHELEKKKTIIRYACVIYTV
jgi:hypothetical protein